MAKIIKSNINSSGSYKSHGNLSSKHHSSSTTRKEKLKGGGSRSVTDSVNSTKTINETQNYATTRSTTITSTRKTRSEYFIPLLSMPFWFVIIFLIMAMGTFNVMMNNNGLGKWELKEEYEIDNVYTLSDIQDMQLDTPITELNNHSLREVFEDNNLVSTWLYVGTRNRMIGDYIEIDSNNDSQYAYQYILNGSIGDKWYTRNTTQRKSGTSHLFGVFPYNQHLGSLSLQMTDYLYNAQTIDIDYSYSVITSSSTNGITLLFGRNSNPTTKSWTKDVYAINITSLGIDNLTVEQMDYWYGVYNDILDENVNNETKAALGTIDYRNPKILDDDVVYFDYYHMTYEQQEKLGLPAINNLTTVSSVLVGGKYLDNDNVQQETPGIFPTLTKLITSVTDVIEWFSDNTTKLIRYVDKGYENIVGETLNDTWKRTTKAWSWLRDQFGIVGGAS